VLAQLPAQLRQHPGTQLIFAHNDPMARAARQVVQAMGLAQRVRIIGVDGLPGPGNGLDLVARGDLQATLLYSPGGEEAIRTALRILGHEHYTKDNILVTMVVDSTNVQAVRGQTERLLTQQRDLFQQQQRWQRQQERYNNQSLLVYLLLASLLGAVALGALAWRSSRLNRRIRRTLEGQNAEISQQRNQIADLAEQARAAAEEVRRTSEAKLRFFTNFSHELRTPLTLILGPVEDLLTSPADDLTPAQRHDLSLVRRNAQRLLQLVNQLMDFRKIDVGKMAVHATEGDLVGFVREIMDVFEKTARRRNITFRFAAAEPVIFLWFDGEILDKIFFNLLSNAFKYTPDGGQITVSIGLNEADKTVSVSVADTGRGIAAADQPHILEWFYQGSQPTPNSSGLGLALADGLTRLHQGSLTFTSEPGRGSTFSVHLPLDKPAAFRNDQEPDAWRLGSPASALADELLPSQPASPPPARPEATALVIEDNEEVRDFLVQKLQPHFVVSTAADGTSGLRLASEAIPDIIVCDVGLPELSGLDVAAALKGDWRTSHIPLVLLTAQGAPEQQVAGVQAGADLYLTKPFNPTFLLESLRTLLRNRDQLREHFHRQLSAGAPPPAATPLASPAPLRVDQKFLADLAAIIEGRLDQPGLGVDDIAHSLGVSRTQLYRKVKALLGTGVTEYIQTVRLTKARQLLLQEGSTVADVAYQTGFSSPSYFSTAFKGKYQVSPSEFKALHTHLRV
jgi:signal transduction histidine kinase/AraC-like DNA-binding protein